MQQRLTKAQACGKLGLSPRQLEGYIAEGIPCTGSSAKRRFPWPEIRHWRDELLIKQGERRAERKAAPKADAGVAAVEVRRELAKTRLLELELAEAEGKLIPLAMHEELLRKLCELLAAKCKGLGRYLGDVQLATTDVEAAALLERISDELLRALRQTADEIED